MTVSVAIMAHPKREKWIPRLVDAIDADVEVVWDRHNDRWDTGRRSLLAYDPAATHHLVVQDDAIVCRDLVAGIEKAVLHSGDRPVGLYMGRILRPGSELDVAYRKAEQTRSPWVKMKGPWWGVGIVIPTAHIDALVAWGDGRGDIANYDKRISRWYEQRGVVCWYTRPSLVEHRHGGKNPSLIEGRTGRNRHAHRFIGKGQSALDVDWAEGT